MFSSSRRFEAGATGGSHPHRARELAMRLRGLLSDQSGQAATEYILIIGLISLPIYAAFELVFKQFLEDFIAAIIGSFTRG